MAERTERRASERFPVSADAVCEFVSPVVEDFGPARIKDLSMDGLGILLTRRVEPGTLLTITLANRARHFAKTVLVRVIHATPFSSSCLVGGTFTVPLTYQEMTALVM